MGPERSQESAGTSAGAVSVEELGVWGENRGAVTSQENRGAAAACRNVASGATLMEILEAVRDTIVAIEDGDVDIAKPRLRALLASDEPDPR